MMESKAADSRCVFLGRDADHYHHLSGRHADGHYLDPSLVIPLARRQHVVEHQGWRVAGIGEGMRTVDNVLRLCRIAHMLVRLGEHRGIGVVVLPATMVRELGKVLQRISKDLESEQ